MTDREGSKKGKGSIDGTEGGVTQKERNKAKSGSGKQEKTPEGPKEVLEGHEHAEEKIKGKDSTGKSLSGKEDKTGKSEKSIGGLEVCVVAQFRCIRVCEETC